MSKYKAIIWDWGGVCCSGGEHFACKRMLEFTGLRADQMSERSRDLEVKLYLGEITEKVFWNSVIMRFKMEDENFSVEELRQGYYQSYILYDEILELIRNSKHKYTHALLSNMGEDMSGRIRYEHGANKLFNPIIFSHEVGMRKPDQSIFRMMLENLKFDPSECLFIDDAEKNIVAAKELGIGTICFRNKEIFLKEFYTLSSLL